MKGRRAFDAILNALAAGAALLVGLLMLAICYQVAMRYFFHSPPPWVPVLSEYSLIYIAFLGAAWLLKVNGHVRVDLAVSRLKPGGQSFASMVTSAVGFILCLVLTWISAATTWDHFIRDIATIEAIKMPKFLLLIIIPIGSLLLSIEFIRQAYAHFGNWRRLTAGDRKPEGERA